MIALVDVNSMFASCETVYIKHQLEEDKMGKQLSIPYPGSPVARQPGSPAARLRAVSNNEMQMSDCNAPVRARLITEPYRCILKTPSYAGGYS